MAGFWSVIIPEDGKNYVRNPSFELDTTGHASFGAGAGTRTRVSSWQKFGAYAYEIICTTAPFGNAYVNNVAGDLADFAIGDILTYSVYVKVIAGTLSVVASAPGSGVSNVTTNIVAPFEGRVEIIFPAIVATPVTALQLFTYFPAGTGTAYIDGLQIEEKSYATTYIDGDQNGCKWMGIPHASKSTRSSKKSSGGRIYNLDDLGFYVTGVSGGGMPPVELITQPQSLLPGNLLRDYHIDARTIQLTSTTQPTSQADLHSKRKDLIDAIRPDKTGNLKPIILRYAGANSLKPVDIEVVYDSGLGYDHPSKGFNEEVPLRFIAPYPFWREEGNRAYALNYTKTLTSHNYIIAKEDGIWSLMGTGISAGATRTVNVIKKGADGRIYVGGFFDTVGGIATTRGLAVWSPETKTWSSLGGQVAVAGVIYDIAFASNGDVIVVGNFTDFNGVANTAHIAKWVKATNTWTSITSTVANNPIYGVAYDNSGNIIVVGDFTAIGGVGCVRVALYTGSAWQQFGSGLNARGTAVAVSADNIIHVGGLFTTANGVTVNYIAKWNGTTFVAFTSGGSTGVGSAASAPVLKIFFATDGSMYIGGLFQSGGGYTTYRILRWNGTQFQDMGGGVYDTTVSVGRVLAIDEDPDTKDIVLAGSFTVAGGDLGFQSVGFWNGSLYGWTDFELQVTDIYAFKYVDRENMYLAFSTATAGSANDIYVSELTTVNYEGTTKTSPIIRIKRSGGTEARIKWIENLANNSVLWIDYSLQNGEEITIDLTPSEKIVKSSFSGEKWNAILPISDLNEFIIQPGENKIKVFIETTGSPTIEAFLVVDILHWSFDGVAV